MLIPGGILATIGSLQIICMVPWLLDSFLGLVASRLGPGTFTEVPVGPTDTCMA